MTEIVAWAHPAAQIRAVRRHSVGGLYDYVYARCFEVTAVRLRFSFSNGMVATVSLSASRAGRAWLTVQGPDSTRARREEFFHACLTRAREENDRIGLRRKDKRAAFGLGVATSLVGSAVFALVVYLLQHT